MIKIRDITLGQGTAKIIAPVTAKSQAEIIAQAREIINLNQVDLIEWRADFYEDILNKKNLLEILKNLRAELNAVPLIFTLRTQSEGGEFNYGFKDYCVLNLFAAQSKCVDIIDVEILDLNSAKDLIKLIKDKGCYVIGSKHNFKFTPAPEKIIKILHRAKLAGADVLKAAFMPESKLDVINLIYASGLYHAENPDDLILTISMGDLGKVSRTACNLTGSCATFGAVKASSAPGQINAVDLRNILDILN